jgi:hypothetical protein
MKAKYDGDGAFLGYDPVKVPVVASGPYEAVDAIADKIRSTMQPAQRAKIEQWLAELSVISAQRKSDQITLELMLGAYTKRLEGYPADMVRDVLIIRIWKFFPTWAELSEILESMMADRRAMLAACEAPRPMIRPPREPERQELTPEQRAEHQVIMADLLRDMRAKAAGG